MNVGCQGHCRVNLGAVLTTLTQLESTGILFAYSWFCWHLTNVERNLSMGRCRRVNFCMKYVGVANLLSRTAQSHRMWQIHATFQKCLQVLFVCVKLGQLGLNDLNSEVWKSAMYGTFKKHPDTVQKRSFKILSFIIFSCLLTSYFNILFSFFYSSNISVIIYLISSLVILNFDI